MLAVDKTIGQMCQALKVSEQTLHRWRNLYGGMKAEETKRLKELEEENKRLEKLLAEAEPHKATLEEAIQGITSDCHFAHSAEIDRHRWSNGLVQLGRRKAGDLVLRRRLVVGEWRREYHPTR